MSAGADDHLVTFRRTDRRFWNRFILGFPLFLVAGSAGRIWFDSVIAQRAFDWQEFLGIAVLATVGAIAGSIILAFVWHEAAKVFDLRARNFTVMHVRGLFGRSERRREVPFAMLRVMRDFEEDENSHSVRLYSEVGGEPVFHWHRNFAGDEVAARETEARLSDLLSDSPGGGQSSMAAAAELRALLTAAGARA